MIRELEVTASCVGNFVTTFTCPMWLVAVKSLLRLALATKAVLAAIMYD